MIELRNSTAQWSPAEIEGNGTDTALIKPFSWQSNAKRAVVAAALIASHTGAQADIPRSKTVFIKNDFEKHLADYEKNVAFPLSRYFDEISATTLKACFSRDSITESILSFKALNENWDGYGAYPLEVGSAANAIKLLGLVGDRLACTLTNLYPNPHGTISFEWENPAGEILSVEIGNKSMSYYFSVLSEPTVFMDQMPINETQAKNIARYISRL